MANTKTVTVAGSVIHFAPFNGTTSTKTIVPADTDLTYEATTAPWILFGTVQGSSTSPTMEKRELKKCAPGLRVTAKELVVSMKIEHRFEIGEYNEGVHKLLNGLTASGSAPYSGGVQQEGWLRIARYTADNTLFSEDIVHVQLSLDGAVDFNDDFIKPKFVATVVQNSAATSTYTASEA